MTFEQAKELLSKANRYELRDHAFGDCEVTWEIKEEIMAVGYFSSSCASVTMHPGPSFEFDKARELRKCGKLHVERNDETGPDEYQEGVTMPGLTLEGVRKELEEG